SALLSGPGRCFTSLRLTTVASSCSAVGFGCDAASLHKGHAAPLKLMRPIKPIRVARSEMRRLHLATAFIRFAFMVFSLRILRVGSGTSQHAGLVFEGMARVPQ